MEELDIRNIWKLAYQDDQPLRRYSLEDIRNYRNQKSQQTTKSSRLMILIDIGYKSLIIIALVFLLISLGKNPPYQLLIWILLVTIAILIFIEIIIICRLQAIKETDAVIDNLKNKLDYLRTSHRLFIFLHALSSPLFVLSGFFWYFYLKYGEIRLESPIEDPVMYIFLVIAFSIAYFSQIPLFRKQIKELNECIFDMDDSFLASISMAVAKQRKRKYLILFSILILIGFLIFIIFLFKSQ